MLAAAQGPRPLVASSMIPSVGIRSNYTYTSWLGSSWPSRSPTRWWSTCPNYTYTTIKATAAP
jgi:hypothetical protein